MTASLVGQYAIGTFASPTNNTTADADTVRGNDNTIATQHNAHDSNSKLHIQQGLFSERPAFGTAGQVYLATDTFRLYVDTGAAWTELRYLVVDASGNAAIGGGLSLSGGTPAATGALRLAVNTGLNWRNNANTADIAVLYTNTNVTHLAGEGRVSFDVNGATYGWLDVPANPGETSFVLYDFNTSAIRRVYVGAADSGGTGYRMLRVLN